MRPDGPGGSLDPAEGPGPSTHRVLDVGLQHERTALAWDRTGLALLVVGALHLRSALTDAAVGWLLPGAATLVIGGVVLWWGSWRYRRREPDLRAGRSPVRPRLVVVTGLTTVAVGLASLLLVLR